MRNCIDSVLLEYEDMPCTNGAHGEDDLPGFDMLSDLEIVQVAKEWLRSDGLGDGPDLDNTAKLVWLCEAVNWAAKVVDPRYYSLKPGLIDAVAKLPGISSGWAYDEYDNVVFYMGSVGSGVASFHDPDQQIFISGRWGYPWSGVTRQEHALDVWGGNTDLAQDLARRSQPGMVE